MAITCDLCGATPPGDVGGQPPLTWSTSFERGRAQHFCETCTREHVRSMEGKLDPEFW